MVLLMVLPLVPLIAPNPCTGGINYGDIALRRHSSISANGSDSLHACAK